MPRTACICCLLTLLAIPAALAQHRPSGPPSGPSSGSTNPRNNPGNVGGFPTQPQNLEMVVHVVLPNDHPVTNNVEVQLLSTSGGVVTSYFTNTEGEVTFQNINTGSYRLKVRGPGLVETTTDAFTVDSYGSSHQQWVHVQEERTESGQTSTQPMVSATELNVPDKAKKEFNKGNEAMVANDPAKALEHYNKAVTIYPKYGIAFNNMGAAYMHMKDTEQARASFQKAVDADPLLASANANLARIKFLEKKPQEAILLLDRALTSEPTNPEFLFLMARAQLDSEHFDQAIAYAHKVHSQQEHRKFAGAHLVAGSAFEAENKLEDARVEYELFLKEAPEAPQAAQVRNEVTRLSAAASNNPAVK